MKFEIEIEKPYWWVLFPCVSLGLSRNGGEFSISFLGVSLRFFYGYCKTITLPYIAVTFGNVFYRLEFDLYLTREYHWGYAFWRKNKDRLWK